MSRIAYIPLPRDQYPYGRLVCEASYDSAECVMFFVVPSRSQTNVVHGLSIDAVTTEVVCGCMWATCHTQARKCLKTHGTELEQLYFLRKRSRLYPSILRHHSGLCAHAKLCQKWIKRHGLWRVMKDVEALAIQKLSRERVAC